MDDMLIVEINSMKSVFITLKEDKLLPARKNNKTSIHDAPQTVIY